MNTIKKLLLASVVLLSAQYASAQASPGEIHGRIFEKKDVPCADQTIVWVNLAGGPRKTMLDDEGRFIIKPLDAGNYTVYIKVQLRPDTLKYAIEVRSNEISRIKDVYLDQIEIADDGEVLPDFVLEGDPLIIIDQPAVVKMNAKQLEHMPVKRDIKQLAAVMTSDVKEFGGANYIRGSRADAVLYIIDGVKQSDRVINVPGSAINNVMVYTGGVPAKYGDCMGGVVIVETKSYFNLYYQWLSKQ